jgi:hypothetical protein
MEYGSATEAHAGVFSGIGLNRVHFKSAAFDSFNSDLSSCHLVPPSVEVTACRTKFSSATTFRRLSWLKMSYR